MKSNWKKVQLVDCVSTVGDGLHGTPIFDDKGEYYFINGNNLQNNRVIIKNDTKKVAVSEYEKYKKPLGDRTLLVSINGTLGNIGEYKGEKVILGKSACYFNVIDTVDKGYIRYTLLNKDFQDYLVQYATGTTIKNVSLKQMREFSFYLPTFREQRSISNILSCIDSKIENNTAINHHLEQMAQAIFKSWFVDFVPWGGEMPEDWQTYSLGELAIFTSGYSYKSSELQASKTAMATIKNFERKGGFKLDGFKEILIDGKIKPEQYIKQFDILVSHTDVTQNADIIGNAEMLLTKGTYENIIISLDLVKVSSCKPELSNFVLFSLLRSSQFKNHALGYVNGTTVLHLSKKALPEYTLALPRNMNELCELHSVLEPIYHKMALNIEESNRLSILRDTLLPRLMSGELSVADI